MSERISDEEWGEISTHAGFTAEQDQRHKAIFFDEHVARLVAHIDDLRERLAGCERYALRIGHAQSHPFDASNANGIVQIAREGRDGAA